jgi:hypothetical protein
LGPEAQLTGSKGAEGRKVCVCGGGSGLRPAQGPGPAGSTGRASLTAHTNLNHFHRKGRHTQSGRYTHSARGTGGRLFVSTVEAQGLLRPSVLRCFQFSLAKMFRTKVSAQAKVKACRAEGAGRRARRGCKATVPHREAPCVRACLSGCGCAGRGGGGRRMRVCSAHHRDVVSGCVRPCVRVCVRASVNACVRACVRACVQERGREGERERAWARARSAHHRDVVSG